MAKVVPHLPQICPVCKNKDNLYFIKAFTGVSNLIAKLTFVRFLPKWAKAIKDEFLNAFALYSKFGQSGNFPHFCSM